MIELDVKITGNREIEKELQSVGVKINDLTVPLLSASKIYMQKIKQNFTNNGRTFGEPWKPLSPATISIKRRLYNKGNSIAIEKPLVRKGLLRNSFGYDVTGKKTVAFFNTAPYASIHQDGATTRFRGKFVTIPRRVLIKLDEENLKIFADAIEQWIDQAIK
jgi:phage gpG-like protein